MNPLPPKLIRLRWRDNGLDLFSHVHGPWLGLSPSTHSKDLCQYPATLTLRLANNSLKYSIWLPQENYLHQNSNSCKEDYRKPMINIKENFEHDANLRLFSRSSRNWLTSLTKDASHVFSGFGRQVLALDEAIVTGSRESDSQFEVYCTLVGCTIIK